MTRLKRFGGGVIAASLVSTAWAQTSEYFLMTGDQARFHVVQNGALLRSWGPAAGTANYQYPITVRDTIRTTGASVGEIGAEYDFNGNDLGARYPHPAGTNRGWDGATDGQFNYTLDTSGNVSRFGLDWQNPVLLFSAGDFGGITYDPSNDSLWVCRWSSSTVTNYSKAGAILSTFSTGHTQNMALAMDYADGTLWLHNRNTMGTFEQYSRTGQLLNSVAVPNMNTQNTLGGEFRFGVSQGCGRNAALKAACKAQGTKVIGKLKKADPNALVVFRLDGGQEIEKTTNAKGKAKAKWSNQQTGSHTVTVCDLSESC